MASFTTSAAPRLEGGGESRRVEDILMDPIGPASAAIERSIVASVEALHAHRSNIVFDHPIVECKRTSLRSMSAALACLLFATLAIAQKPADAPKPAPPQKSVLRAIVVTTRGPFIIELHDDAAPMTVANFCNLVKKGFFDGTRVNTSSRVFRVMGNPSDDFDPGYRIHREFSPKHRYDRAGRVGAWRGESKTTAMPTQFAITVKEQSSWNLDVPCFGTVVDGQNVVNLLDTQDLIERITLEGDPSALLSRYADRVRQWDEALAKSGWTPASPRAKDGTPPAVRGNPATDPDAPIWAPDAPRRTPGAPATPAKPGDPPSPPATDAPAGNAPPPAKVPSAKDPPAKNPPANNPPANNPPAKDPPAKSPPPGEPPAK